MLPGKWRLSEGGILFRERGVCDASGMGIKRKILKGRGYSAQREEGLSGGPALYMRTKFEVSSFSVGGSVAEWLACWTQARKSMGSNRSRDPVG